MQGDAWVCRSIVHNPARTSPQTTLLPSKHISRGQQHGHQAPALSPMDHHPTPGRLECGGRNVWQKASMACHSSNMWLARPSRTEAAGKTVS